MYRWILGLALLPSVAMAVPVQVTHSGRLLDASGLALEGPAEVAVALYGDAQAGGVLYQEVVDLRLNDGFYTVTLGASGDLDHTVLNVDALFVEVSVDGVAVGGRAPVNTVPSAAVAYVARSLDSGQPNGTQFLPDGGLVAEQVESGACSPDGRIGYNGSLVVCTDGEWSSVGNSPPVISALIGPPNDRIEPAATLPVRVVAGDPEGTDLRYAWSFVGDRAGWSLSDADQQTAQLTAPAPTTGPGDVIVRITVSDDAGAQAVQDLTITRFAERLCSGYNTPALNRGDGLYYISPTGVTANAFQAYCEMDDNGGGWTACMAVPGGNQPDTNEFLHTYTSWGSNQPRLGVAGMICDQLGAEQLYGESWSSSSGSLDLRTGPVDIDDAFFQLGTFRGYSNSSGDCIGINNRSSMQPSTIGGTTCGTLSNSFTHASGIAVSDGDEWRGMHGKLNSRTYPYDQHMCNLSQWCGNGTSPGWLLLYAR